MFNIHTDSQGKDTVTVDSLCALQVLKCQLDKWA